MAPRYDPAVPSFVAAAATRRRFPADFADGASGRMTTDAPARAPGGGGAGASDRTVLLVGLLPAGLLLAVLGHDHVRRADGRLGVVSVVDRPVRSVGHAGALVRPLQLEILFLGDVVQLVVLVRQRGVELGLRDGGETILEEPA